MSLFQSGRVSIFLLIMALAPVGSSAGATAANYVGLVYSGEPSVSAQSGIFTMSVSPNRKFSGRMTIGPRNAGFSGRLDTNGAAHQIRFAQG